MQVAPWWSPLDPLNSYTSSVRPEKYLTGLRAMPDEVSVSEHADFDLSGSFGDDADNLLGV